MPARPGQPCLPCSRPGGGRADAAGRAGQKRDRSMGRTVVRGHKPSAQAHKRNNQRQLQRHGDVVGHLDRRQVEAQRHGQRGAEKLWECRPPECSRQRIPQPASAPGGAAKSPGSAKRSRCASQLPEPSPKSPQAPFARFPSKVSTLGFAFCFPVMKLLSRNQTGYRSPLVGWMRLAPNRLPAGSLPVLRLYSSQVALIRA